MLQAVFCDGSILDALTLGQDHLGPSEVNVGWREIVDALVVADVTVVLDKASIGRSRSPSR